MLFFGHIGITAGTAKMGDILLSMTEAGNGEGWLLRFALWLNRVKGQMGPIDFRLVLLGSLLPDIIDKPLFLLLNNASIGGRDYAHTLLFNLALLVGGLFLVRSRQSWLLILSLSSIMHLILDQIWNSPVTLFWPLLGSLPKGEKAGWLSRIVYGLFTYPEVYLPEIIGLVIVLLFTYRLVRGKGIISFIREGAVD